MSIRWHRVDGMRTLEVNVAVTLFRRRWVRWFLYVGPQLFTRTGIWHTDTGTVHGWNLRIGRGLGRLSLLTLTHTRPARGPRDGQG